jgi:hypothetical protein
MKNKRIVSGIVVNVLAVWALFAESDFGRNFFAFSAPLYCAFVLLAILIYTFMRENPELQLTAIKGSKGIQNSKTAIAAITVLDSIVAIAYAGCGFYWIACFLTLSLFLEVLFRQAIVIIADEIGSNKSNVDFN